MMAAAADSADIQKLAGIIDQGSFGDEATRAIFQKLTQDLAAIHEGDAGAAAPPPPPPPGDGAAPPDVPTHGGHGAGEDGYDEEYDGDYGDDWDGDDYTEATAPSIRDTMPNRPLPIDLWRASHEVEAPRKQVRSP
jgi:hypothetical protein